MVQFIGDPGDVAPGCLAVIGLLQNLGGSAPNCHDMNNFLTYQIKPTVETQSDYYVFQWYDLQGGRTLNNFRSSQSAYTSEWTGSNTNMFLVSQWTATMKRIEWQANLGKRALIWKFLIRQFLVAVRDFLQDTRDEGFAIEIFKERASLGTSAQEKRLLSVIRKMLTPFRDVLVTKLNSISGPLAGRAMFIKNNFFPPAARGGRHSHLQRQYARYWRC